MPEDLWYAFFHIFFLFQLKRSICITNDAHETWKQIVAFKASLLLQKSSLLPLFVNLTSSYGFLSFKFWKLIYVSLLLVICHSCILIFIIKSIANKWTFKRMVDGRDACGKHYFAYACHLPKCFSSKCSRHACKLWWEVLHFWLNLRGVSLWGYSDSTPVGALRFMHPPLNI